MYKIYDELKFGKYEGFTIREIYCGQKIISSKLINEFLSDKLNNLSFTIQADNISKDVKVEIKKFKILTNNELFYEIEYKTDPNLDLKYSKYEVFDHIIWDLILNDESKEAIEVFGSANEFILNLNAGKSIYKPSADPSYINWCIINLDNFCLNPRYLSELQQETCHHFYGVKLFAGGFNSNIYKYVPNVIVKKYEFDNDTIILNKLKYNK